MSNLKVKIKARNEAAAIFSSNKLQSSQPILPALDPIQIDPWNSVSNAFNQVYQIINEQNTQLDEIAKKLTKE